MAFTLRRGVPCSSRQELPAGIEHQIKQGLKSQWATHLVRTDLCTEAWADITESTPVLTVLAVKAPQSAMAWKGRLRVLVGRDMFEWKSMASCAPSWEARDASNQSGPASSKCEWGGPDKFCVSKFKSKVNPAHAHLCSFAAPTC